MTKINLIQNVLVGCLHGTLQGPPVFSQEFVDNLFTRMDVATWDVFNGATLQGPLPFGMFAEILPYNMSVSKLRVKLAPGYPDAIAFSEVCVKAQQIDPHTKSATICRKIVPLNADVEAGPGIWESFITPIDDTHGLRTTVKDVVLFPQKEYLKSREVLIPDRFRGAIVTTEISETKAGVASAPVLEEGQILRSIEQVTPTTIRETIRSNSEVDSATLSHAHAYAEGTNTIEVENFSWEEPELDTGLNVVKAEVLDLGNGSFLKSTESVAEWPLLKGSKIDPRLNAPVGYTERQVAPPISTTAESNVEYTPINKDRSLRREIQVPHAALMSYYMPHPIKVSPRIPRVLKSIEVIWNTANENGDMDTEWAGHSEGTSYSLSANLSDQANAQVAASPELIIELEDVMSVDLPGVAHVFFLPYPISEAQILARVGARRWPIFKPRTHTIVGLGQKIGCTVNVTVSAAASGTTTGVPSFSQDKGKTTSVQKNVSLSANVVQFGPCIHGAINVIGDTVRNLSAFARGEINIYGENFPTVLASKAAIVNARASVYPTYFPPTEGASVYPTSGIYLLDARVENYDYGYAMVYVETFDASVLA